MDDKTLYDTFNLNSQGDEDSKRHNMGELSVRNCRMGHVKIDSRLT